MATSASASDSEAFDEEDCVVLTEWKELFEEISRFLCDCERNENVTNLGRAEYTYEHLEHIVLVLIYFGSGLFL